MGLHTSDQNRSNSWVSFVIRAGSLNLFETLYAVKDVKAARFCPTTCVAVKVRGYSWTCDVREGYVKVPNIPFKTGREVFVLNTRLEGKEAYEGVS